ncbi:cytochrome c oxidase assembly protein [Candidatus Persebacteraceae bacterium Df01]|jgi:cytochrome c oxidase assembly protein subunit 11|uniref:Cytochrome c oxidase assembly protein CtaG n=1 Tax=Candidatus Doriopsillibacter californiensis TaxID=2970740 RepID=A0ABT7QJP1_9GAMM|nr:cytochrome c oxidase assembly protein [Candidatus Persebacteraceae bacterium Df01]
MNITLSKFNALAAAKLTLMAVMMFGFGYAMVPLYYKICQVTGIKNLLNPADTDDIAVDPNRRLRVELDTNARGLVSMSPSVRLMDSVESGQTYSVIYTLKNLSNRRLVGQAIPSYAPARAGAWFKKIQCFCFDQLTMEPDEVREAPVVFIIDAAMPEDINTVALSYTFFEVEGAQ